MQMSKREQNRKMWRSHIEEQSRSSSTQGEYCKLHGLSLQCFQSYKKKFRGEGMIHSSLPSPFVKVEVERGSTPDRRAMPDPRWLAELVSHLVNACAT